MVFSSAAMLSKCCCSAQPSIAAILLAARSRSVGPPMAPRLESGPLRRYVVRQGRHARRSLMRAIGEHEGVLLPISI